jgi:phosphatidylglycerol lysyltransferase
VEQHGRSSLARFALLDHKSYYFSPSGQTVIAYVAKGEEQRQILHGSGRQ